MYKTLVFLFAVLAVALTAPGYLAPSFYSGLVPAPYTIHSGYTIHTAVEPVEQHGYTIVY